jgi:hypothetical protein
MHGENFPRIMIVREPTAYHVISRTALDGFPIGVNNRDTFVHNVHSD